MTCSAMKLQFDKTTEWDGGELSKDYVKLGKYSMRWKNHTKTVKMTSKKFMKDWTEVDKISMTLYNVVENTEILYFMAFSETQLPRRVVFTAIEYL